VSTNREARNRAPDPWEASQTAAAARDAAAIGGRAGDEHLDPAQRPLVEAGEGVSEGFELAEEELIEAAAHGDSACDPLADAFPPEPESDRATAVYGEADSEESTEASPDDR
jgi:hypothetical protein